MLDIYFNNIFYTIEQMEISKLNNVYDGLLKDENFDRFDLGSQNPDFKSRTRT